MRARYDQPYEDHILGGGHRVLDAAIERVERHDGGYRVYCSGTTEPGSMILDVDEVIAATGFTTPLRDLPGLGVKTFMQGRLPSQTAYWESATVPGIYFAGSVTQGAIGLKKYGLPSGSAAVHGFRYNADVLARHLARTRFGIEQPARALARDDVVPFLVEQVATEPALWHQQAYLARVVTFDPEPHDAGIVPLSAFLDQPGADAVAATVETDASGDIHPALYVRRDGAVEERLLPSERFLDFASQTHVDEIAAIVRPFI